jgi:hypothetical protein
MEGEMMSTDPPPALSADEVERIRARHWLNYTWTDNITGTVSPVCVCALNAPYPCEVVRLLDALSASEARRERVEADIKDAVWMIEYQTYLYQHAEYDTEVSKYTALSTIEDVTKIALLAMKLALEALAAPAGEQPAADGRAEGGGE